MDRLCVCFNVRCFHIKTFSSTEITDGGQSWPCHVTFPVADKITLLIKSQVFLNKNNVSDTASTFSGKWQRLGLHVSKKYVFTRVDKSGNICKLS